MEWVSVLHYKYTQAKQKIMKFGSSYALIKLKKKYILDKKKGLIYNNLISIMNQAKDGDKSFLKQFVPFISLMYLFEGYFSKYFTL